jgi:2-amino-4-hydroxy-6-hydroxymethyldihydropteridine diphosphokinase
MLLSKLLEVKMNNNIAFISLGTNIENREQHLQTAINDLQRLEQIEVIDQSSIYETAPVGYTEQANFLNMVIKIKTSYNPQQLIAATMEIEEKNGRVRTVHWGPRTIDLDILLYNQENIESEQLIVPHPRMTERAFVMIPLLEIDRKIEIPNNQLTIREVVERLQDKEGVRLWKRKNGVEE